MSKAIFPPQMLPFQLACQWTTTYVVVHKPSPNPFMLCCCPLARHLEVMYFFIHHLFYSPGLEILLSIERLIQGSLAAHPVATLVVSRAWWQHLEHGPLERAVLN